LGSAGTSNVMFAVGDRSLAYAYMDARISFWACANWDFCKKRAYTEGKWLDTAPTRL
jgi:hypothetical protein